MATSTPALLARLVDGAATDPDGVAPLATAVEDHRRDRAAPGYGGAIGLLVVRASAVPDVLRAGPLDGIEVCVVADAGQRRLASAIEALGAAGAPVRRIEMAVAKRGEDPVPGLRRLLTTAGELPPDVPATVHAEIPLAMGLIDALDLLADKADTHRRDGGGPRLGLTIRVGGLAAELFPNPAALAGVVCACRDRGLRFTVNAGLHRAVRHNDPETGFTHHGALNLLADCLAAASGATPGAVAERLATTDPLPLLEIVRARRDAPRPLWEAMTTRRTTDLIADLTGLGLLSGEGPRSTESMASDNR